MERCPNCRARWDGGEHCRRCGLDLKPLLAVEQAAHRRIARALGRLAEGDRERALTDLAQARALHREPFIDLLLGLIRSDAASERLAEAAFVTAGAQTHQTPASDMPRAAGPVRRAMVDFPDWPFLPRSEPRLEDQAS